MTDEARAISEVARTAGEAIRAAGGLGSYLNRVFGSIPDNLLGLAGGDWLDHMRRRHLARLEAHTARLVERLSAERITEPSPSVLIPLLKGAVDEARPELQALWAALLANAMFDGGRKVRRDYFDVLAKMEPIDPQILDIIAQRPSPIINIPKRLDEDRNYLSLKLNELSISQDDYDIYVQKLGDLRCINPKSPVMPSLSAFGRGLQAACTVT